ncbi:Hypothetical protein, putative [Bodo saltans]|uniref:Mitochondrial import inner membrane translocase subunit TIM50 n=1 Tax=Bodo saltans TaxID=75058 RepID=A0A0S4IS02_BODSA|nr:Hypothetical protein, putative [Bodo saltans]|eukprot:CUE71173.1 Hypothetical protein, putative [Bodo saltans]
MATTLQRPLLIFGLRGTLIERLHTSKLPSDITVNPQHTFGLHKVWVRPHALETLVALSEVCDVALWSSTTAKNTHPIVQGVFGHTAQGAAAAAASSSSSNSGFSSSGFSTPPAVSIPFKFVWTREHTSTDDFRRLLSSQHDDDHATIKDLQLVKKSFPDVLLERTILVDDTPSKSRLQAGNLLWLESFGEKNFASDDGMLKLKEFVMKEILPAPDVRLVLPRRL